MSYTYKEAHVCNMCSSKNIRYLGERYSPSQEKTPIYQCTSCSLIFANPIPIPQNVGDHYDVDPSDYWKEEYLKFEPTYFQNQIDTFKTLFNGSSITALDIGAGLGKAMKAMEMQGWIPYGIEPSKAFFDKAVELEFAASERLQNVSMEEANFEENTFQFITFGAVLEHLYDPAEAIQRALNWLAPGGLIQIEVPNARWLTHTLVNSYYKLKGQKKVANLSPLHTPFHLYEFSLESFEKHGASCGYEVAYHTYYLCDTYLPKVLDPLLKPYMARTNTGMQLEVWLQKHTHN